MGTCYTKIIISISSLKGKATERRWMLMDAGFADIKSRALQMQKNTKAAETLLRKLCPAPDDEAVKSKVFHCLQQCMNLKYGIEERKETDFVKLGILSLKTADAGGKLDEETLRTLVKTQDCHRFPAVLQMKTSFILFVERTLGLTFDDDSAVAVKNLEELADLVCLSWERKAADG